MEIRHRLLPSQARGAIITLLALVLLFHAIGTVHYHKVFWHIQLAHPGLGADAGLAQPMEQARQHARASSASSERLQQQLAISALHSAMHSTQAAADKVSCLYRTKEATHADSAEIAKPLSLKQLHQGTGFGYLLHFPVPFIGPSKAVDEDLAPGDGFPRDFDAQVCEWIAGASF